jgi:hypothetical protein
MSIAHDLAPSWALITVCGINALGRRTALPSLERKPSVRSPGGGPPTGAPREVAFARAVKCLHQHSIPSRTLDRAGSTGRGDELVLVVAALVMVYRLEFETGTAA